ncbi:hypothetical protein GDO86_011175 [Hymenochirus boettgeri]|uniref:Uncharacterized protein n=1 Tax=Hymenochirus boettgeri TaxID=247094 RepID=A0A8T2JAJ0_9PIPI|nr:hypothetical protein GDO86_011175 [Hymenochirus boettgeri]
MKSAETQTPDAAKDDWTSTADRTALRSTPNYTIINMQQDTPKDLRLQKVLLYSSNTVIQSPATFLMDLHP